MEDRRKVNRRYLLYYMRIYDDATRRQIGNLVDITPQGMMALSESPFPVGETIRLHLELTEEVAAKPHMVVMGRSVWCKPDVTPNLYNVGFEILNLEADDKAIVQKIIEIFGFRDNQPG